MRIDCALRILEACDRWHWGWKPIIELTGIRIKAGLRPRLDATPPACSALPEFNRRDATTA
jgi:hypothetical protein